MYTAANNIRNVNNKTNQRVAAFDRVPLSDTCSVTSFQGSRQVINTMKLEHRDSGSLFLPELMKAAWCYLLISSTHLEGEKDTNMKSGCRCAKSSSWCIRVILVRCNLDLLDVSDWPIASGLTHFVKFKSVACVCQPA